MSKKYFVFLGLFLVAGFLFLNTNLVLAADKYWTGNASTSTIGGKDFWNVANWDTALPASGDNIWLFATSSPNSTIVISTPVSLGAGNVYVGYNQKGNTLANSSAPLTLLIREGASLTNTGVFSVGTSSTVLLTSGSLSVGTTTIQQAASTTIDSVTGATSTVTIAGDFILKSAALYTSPSNSTTTLNLPSGTSGTTTFSAGTSSPTFGYLAFGGTGTTNLQNSITVANRLNIAAGRTLTAGGGTITLSGSNSNSMTFPLEVSGTFTAATSTVTYSGTSATTVASTTYATVNFNGATTYTLGGNSTVTSAATIASGATLAISTFTFTATGSTWTNNGTVTEGTGGKITLASVTNIASTNGGTTAAVSFTADNRPSVYITVNDPSLNLNASSAETLVASTATITAKSGISTTQTVTLTETGASTGIFSGGLTFTLSGSAVSGALAYQGPGTITYAFTDPQDSSDTGSGGTATFTGTAPGGGGGTVAVVVTPAAPATPATPAVTTSTPAAPAAPAAPATVPAAPSLDSVQTKITSVVAKVAALTKTSPATDIAAVQAEIVAILNDLKTIQAAQPAPQGVALGFNFVRPLAFGLRHTDVSNLQKALKTDSSVYPEGTINGYFGPATLRAVKKFQAKYGIAKPGDIGYGKVGPKTRSKLNELYGGK